MGKSDITKSTSHFKQHGFSNQHLRKPPRQFNAQKNPPLLAAALVPLKSPPPKQQVLSHDASKQSVACQNSLSSQYSRSSPYSQLPQKLVPPPQLLKYDRSKLVMSAGTMKNGQFLNKFKLLQSVRNSSRQRMHRNMMVSVASKEGGFTQSFNNAYQQLQALLESGGGFGEEDFALSSNGGGSPPQQEALGGKLERVLSSSTSAKTTQNLSLMLQNRQLSGLSKVDTINNLKDQQHEQRYLRQQQVAPWIIRRAEDELIIIPMHESGYAQSRAANRGHSKSAVLGNMVRKDDMIRFSDLAQGLESTDLLTHLQNMKDTSTSHAQQSIVQQQEFINHSIAPPYLEVPNSVEQLKDLSFGEKEDQAAEQISPSSNFKSIRRQKISKTLVKGNSQDISIKGNSKSPSMHSQSQTQSVKDLANYKSQVNHSSGATNGGISGVQSPQEGQFTFRDRYVQQRNVISAQNARSHHQSSKSLQNPLKSQHEFQTESIQEEVKDDTIFEQEAPAPNRESIGGPEENLSSSNVFLKVTVVTKKPPSTSKPGKRSKLKGRDSLRNFTQSLLSGNRSGQIELGPWEKGGNSKRPFSPNSTSQYQQQQSDLTEKLSHSQGTIENQ
ncbi:hypothetical protein FGO68_gene14577 [Halteria grandinella]|uniref:Uncharacterized protein n=1 Tax=Halteria grandinella TaxID=5974 RepID=A0A8J8P7E2_HALGN|nr:hypothetical protein FGO68_gene14577 [Halteria grandinella]